MISYLIIDDEFIAHEIINGYAELLPDLNHVKSCYDALEAISYLRENTVNLIFLDLNLPKLKGFDFLKTLTKPPQIIVTTAYQEFALEGYELNVKDYLLKPFSFERFVKAVNKIENKKAETSSVNLGKEDERVFLYSNKTHIQIKVKDLLFIEASGNYCKVVTEEKTITVREKISELAKLFPEHQFIRVHKSFVVSKDHVDRIEGNRIFIRTHEIPIGKMYKLNIGGILNSR